MTCDNAETTILIVGKIDIQLKKVIDEQDKYYIMIKRTICQN